MPQPLPEFEHPPLDEVAMGVQFAPLKSFHAAHLGLFWSRIRDRYPDTEDQPPLARQLEAEGINPVQMQAFLQTMPPIPRSWFIDAAKTQLIQLQGDRFLRNWRQIQGTERYPRFAYLIGEFKREWELFLGFLAEESIGQPGVNQCELSYVNTLEPGSEWKDYSELGHAFSLLRPPAQPGFLPAPEILTLETRYKLPDGRGRLHATVQPLFRGRDFKLVLSFNLTARGAPASTIGDEVYAWFNLAHEWVVRAFDQLTDPAMHVLWRKKT